MAITKLDHLKESKKGNPAAHLKNAIRYILNPEKTEGGLLVGGNCGREAPEIYASMLETKEAFDKPYGRQGYHFVISFAPGECTKETALAVGREFCEQYFGSAYEYVYAVHTDHAHMHCHIVFNSVSQIDGRKYRYVNGDWEKYVQPVTDRICEKYGLEKLVYDRNETKGESYAEHLAGKEGRFTHADVIRADIDEAISRSSSYAEFCSALKSMGYEIREGYSERHSAYLSYHAPGFARARRDYRLGEGYRLDDIRNRITHREKEPDDITADFPVRYRLPVFRLSGASRLQVCFVLRVRQATDWHYFAFLRKEQARVRQDLLKIDRLHDMCVYLLDRNLRSEAEVRERLDEVEKDIRKERSRIRASRAADSVWTEEEKRARAAYRRLEASLAAPDLPDEEAERAMDQIMELEEKYPALLFSKARPDRSGYLERLLHERKILSGILKEAPAAADVRDVPRLEKAPGKAAGKEMGEDGRTAGDYALYQRLSQGTRDRG